MGYFRTRARSRRFLLVCAAVTVVVLAATAAIASGAYPGSGVTVYSGCLSSGLITNVAASPTTPSKPCNKNQLLVHLSGGTITSVSAGTGLTGGGSDGAVGLSLASGYQLPQGCASGQVAKVDGSGNWQCADDQNTTYSNGAGLDLNSNTFSVDSNYQLPQTCTSGQFPSSNGAGAGFGCGTDKTYSGADFATSGQDCPAGQFVTGIDASGNLKCAQPSLDALEGSQCTRDGNHDTTQIGIDSTTGAVNVTCAAVISIQVTNGTMQVLNLVDRAIHNGSDLFNECGGRVALSACSLIDPWEGDTVQADMQTESGAFQYTCPGGAPQTSTPFTDADLNPAYEGTCNVTVGGNATITATYTG